jgi:hypothetical protein
MRLICAKYLEGGNETAFAFAVEDHDGSDVAASVAVIGSAPHRDQVLIKVVFVAFHDELMCSCDEREIVDMIELSVSLRMREGGEIERDRMGRVRRMKDGNRGVPPRLLYRQITILLHGVRRPMFEYLLVSKKRKVGLTIWITPH